MPAKTLSNPKNIIKKSIHAYLSIERPLIGSTVTKWNVLRKIRISELLNILLKIYRWDKNYSLDKTEENSLT